MARRILHVTRDYAPLSKGGGVERYIHQLALAFLARGDQPKVVARQVDAAPSAYPTCAATLPQLLRSIRQSDVVHIHGPRTPYAACAGFISCLLGKPFFYTAHCFYEGKSTRQRFTKWLWDCTVERLLFADATRVILLSPYWLETARAKGLPTNRVAIAANGVDSDALRQEAYEPMTLSGNPAILSVSRLDPVKRIDDTIRALNQPGLEAAHLHIVGMGEDEARLRMIAREEAVEARVVFHGFAADARVAGMARAAHLFVLASAAEGMPTTLLEMLARGVPVVASDIPGNRSLLAALGWEYCYPLGDVPALARMIGPARTAVPASVTDAIASQYDWRPISAQIHALYEGA